MINKKILRVSLVCVVGAVACTTGVMYGKADENKEEYKEITSECTNDVATIEYLIGKDGFEKFVDTTSVSLQKAADEKKLQEKIAEIKKAKETYPNWVDGIDFRTYIDYDDYKDYGIIEIDEENVTNVNIREEADENSDVVGIITHHAGVFVRDSKKDSKGRVWYQIESGGVKGYILGDYVKTGDDAQKLIPYVGYLVICVESSTLNIREEATTDSKIIRTIAKNETIPVKAIDDEWVKIDNDGELGYVSREHVDIRFEIPVATPKKTKKKKTQENNGGSGNDTVTNVEVSAEGSEKGISIAEEGLKHVGGKYSFGGTSYSTGVDCSGFTMNVYAEFGYSLPHNSASQASCGTSVPIDSAQPGDLVFYNSGGSIHHVALCIGDGRIVHAADERSGIKTSSMYYQQPVKVVRIVE